MQTNGLAGWIEPPEPIPNGWFQQRGRYLERFLVEMLSASGMEPRGSMRPSGEEIDGSFVLANKTYLLEAKWRKDPLPASDLYAFKGKVDGKLTGTIGVFFSMSNFSSEAIDALKFGKELNLILFDREDLILVDNGTVSFPDAMKAKLRYASEEGQPFYPLAIMVAERTKSIRRSSWDIVVEGEADRGALEILMERFRLRVKPKVWAAGGQLGIPALARHLKESRGSNVAAFISSGASPALTTELQQQSPSQLDALVVIPYDISNWMEMTIDVQTLNTLEMLTQRPEKVARRYARLADIAKLLESNASFASFIDLVRAPHNKH